MFAAVDATGELVQVPGIKKVRYSHEAMIDVLVENPAVSQRELAALFGYTEGWISQVMSSDSFQARLAARKGELVDPAIVASVELRLQGVARQSLEVISEKLTATRSPDLALRALDISSRALGYGAKQATGPAVVQNFVVALPQKSDSPEKWVAEYAPSGGTAPRICPSGREGATNMPGPASGTDRPAGESTPKPVPGKGKLLGPPDPDLEIPAIQLSDGEFQAAAVGPPARLEDLIEEAGRNL